MATADGEYDAKLQRTEEAALADTKARLSEEEVAGCVAAAVRPEVCGRWCEPLRTEEGGWGGAGGGSGGASGGAAAGADELLAWVDAQGGDD